MWNVNFFVTIASFLALLRITRAEKGYANTFVDELLDKLRPKMKEDLDPLKLPTELNSFDATVPYIDLSLSGQIKVYDGSLKGLSSIKRSGNATVYNFTTPAGEVIGINTTLSLKNLNGAYSAMMELFGMWISLNASIKISDCTVRMDLTQLVKRESHPNLTSFSIMDIGMVHVDVKIPVPLEDLLDWVIDELINFFASSFKNLIGDAVDNPIKTLLVEELHRTSLPI